MALAEVVKKDGPDLDKGLGPGAGPGARPPRSPRAAGRRRSSSGKASHCNAHSTLTPAALSRCSPLPSPLVSSEPGTMAKPELVAFRPPLRGCSPRPVKRILRASPSGQPERLRAPCPSLTASCKRARGLGGAGPRRTAPAGAPLARVARPDLEAHGNALRAPSPPPCAERQLRAGVQPPRMPHRSDTAQLSSRLASTCFRSARPARRPGRARQAGGRRRPASSP